MRRTNKFHKMILIGTMSVWFILSGCGQRDAQEEYGVTTEALGDIIEDATEEYDVEAVDVNVEEETVVDSINIENGYLEKMPEEKLHVLTQEVLEEHGKDSTFMKEEKQIQEIIFEVPEGFFVDPELEQPGLYVTERYPIDVSNICYQESLLDPAMQLMTEEIFQKKIQMALSESIGEKIEVVVDSFEEITIDTVPGFRIQCTYEVSDMKLTHLIYAINGDKNYTITYTMTDEYDRMESFMTSAETIQIKLGK